MYTTFIFPFAYQILLTENTYYIPLGPISVGVTFQNYLTICFLCNHFIQSVIIKKFCYVLHFVGDPFENFYLYRIISCNWLIKKFYNILHFIGFIEPFYAMISSEVSRLQRIKIENRNL